MKKQFVTVLLPEDSDTGKLFDGFPPEALYTSDLVEEGAMADIEAMEEFGRSAGAAMYRGIRYRGIRWITP